MGVHHNSANKILNNILCHLLRLPVACLSFYGLKYSVLHYRSIWLKQCKLLESFLLQVSHIKLYKHIPPTVWTQVLCYRWIKGVCFIWQRIKKNLDGGSCQHEFSSFKLPSTHVHDWHNFSHCLLSQIKLPWQSLWTCERIHNFPITNNFMCYEILELYFCVPPHRRD
jgi:hypothetical protein